MNEKFLKYLPDIKKDKDKVQQINPLELQNEQLTISPEDWDKVAKAMEEIINETPNEKKEFVSKMMLFLTTEYILLTRVGETQAMRYSNLLFDNGMYNLYEAYCKRVKKITPTKNRKARILYLPPKLLNVFKKMYINDSKETDFNENQFIFGKDKVFARTTIDRYRTKLLERAGISYVTNHELRHAGISNALYNNADISALADMAGHDKEIMFKIYTQTLKEANKGLTNILGKLTVPIF